MQPLNAERPGVRRAPPRGPRARAAELGQKRGLPEEVVQQVLGRRHRAGPVRRPRRRLHRPPAAAEAGAARDARRRGAAAPRPGPRPAPDRRARGAGGDQVAGPGRAGRAAARDVPARAAEGDPEGARRRRRAATSSASCARSSTRSSCRPRRGRKSSASSAGSSAHRPRVDGGAGHPHLPRVDRRAAVELALATSTSTSRRPQTHPRRGPLRPAGREGPRARVPRRAPAPRSSWTQRGREDGRVPSGRAQGRRSDARRSTDTPQATATMTAPITDVKEARRRAMAQGPDPAVRRPAGRRQDVDRQVDRPRAGPRSTSASRSAARATRPTSAATGAPTSAPCRAASSRG